jgi:hypothetical protein
MALITVFSESKSFIQIMADCDLFQLIEPSADPSCCNEDRVNCKDNQLVGLDLSGRQLSFLPAALLGFRELKELSLADNNLDSIQIPLLFASPTITSLDLSGNANLKEIPAALAANLVGLESVDIRGTGITDVSSLAGIPTLKEVTISNPATMETASNLPGVTIRMPTGGICANSVGECQAVCSEGQSTSDTCKNSGSPANAVASDSQNSSSSANRGLIIGVVFGVLALILIGFVIFYWRKKQSQRQMQRRDHEAAYGPVMGPSSSKGSDFQQKFGNMSNRSPSKHSSEEYAPNSPVFVTPAPPLKYVSIPTTSSRALATSRVFVPDFAKGSVLKSSILRSKFIRASQRHLPGADDASSDEVLLSTGDLVFVEKRFNDGWALGWNHRTGKRGMYPANALSEKAPSSPAIGQAVERPGVPGLLNGVPGGRVIIGKAVHSLREARMLPDPSFSLKQGDIIGVEHVYEDAMAFGYNYSTSQRGFFPLILLHLYHETPIRCEAFDHSFPELDYPTVMYEQGLKEIASATTIAAVMKEFVDRDSLKLEGDVVVFDGSSSEEEGPEMTRTDSMK